MSQRCWLSLWLMAGLVSALGKAGGADAGVRARGESSRILVLNRLRGGSPESKTKKSVERSKTNSQRTTKKTENADADTREASREGSKVKLAKRAKLSSQIKEKNSGVRARNQTGLNTLFFSGAPYRLKAEDIMQSVKEHLQKHQGKTSIKVVDLRFPGRRPKNNGWGFLDFETAAMASEVIDMTQEHPLIIGERTVKLRRALPDGKQSKDLVKAQKKGDDANSSQGSQSRKSNPVKKSADKKRSKSEETGDVKKNKKRATDGKDAKTQRRA